MNQKRYLDCRLLLPLLMLVSTTAWSDDIMSTYQLAAEQDPKYRAAINIYDAENARLGVGRAGLLPFLGAGAGTSRRSQKSTSADNLPGVDGEAEYNVDEWSVQFSQALFDAPAWQIYQQAKINVEKAAFDLSAATQELIYRVASVYGLALVSQENLRVSEAEKQRWQSSLSWIKKGLMWASVR